MMTEQQKTWKARLEATGTTQADFARAQGIHIGIFCDYINLKREPRVSRFQKIEAAIRALECSRAMQ
jgi:predicted transcriptional regulator